MIIKLDALQKNLVISVAVFAASMTTSSALIGQSSTENLLENSDFNRGLESWEVQAGNYSVQSAQLYLDNENGAVDRACVRQTTQAIQPVGTTMALVADLSLPFENEYTHKTVHYSLYTITEISRRKVATDWTIISNNKSEAARISLRHTLSQAALVQVEICLAEYDNSATPLIVDNVSLLQSVSSSWIPLPLNVSADISKGVCPEIMVLNAQTEAQSGFMIEEIRFYAPEMDGGNKRLSVGPGYRTFTGELKGISNECIARYRSSDGTFSVAIEDGNLIVNVFEEQYQNIFSDFNLVLMDYGQAEFYWEWQYVL